MIEIGVIKVHSIEISIAEPYLAKIRLYLGIFIPPAVPSLDASFENLKMFLICHNAVTPR